MARKKNRKGKNNNKKQNVNPTVQKKEDPIVEDTPVVEESGPVDTANVESEANDDGQEEFDSESPTEPLDLTEDNEEGENKDLIDEAENSTENNKEEPIEATNLIVEEERGEEVGEADTEEKDDDLNDSPLDHKEPVDQKEENVPAEEDQTKKVEPETQTESELDLDDRLDQTTELPVEGVQKSTESEPETQEQQPDDSFDFNETNTVEQSESTEDPVEEAVGPELPTRNCPDSMVDDLENDNDEEFVDDQDMPNLTTNEDEITTEEPADTPKDNERVAETTAPIMETITDSANNNSDDDDFNFVTPEAGAIIEDQTNTNQAPESKHPELSSTVPTVITTDTTQNQTHASGSDESAAPPPLPVRSPHLENEHNEFYNASMDDIPLNDDTINVSRSMSPPRLPPRDHHAMSSPPPPKNAVPPPLSEELKSPEFRKNMERFNQETAHHGKHQKLKHRLVSNTSSIPPSPKEPSAADVNLIVNRFRVTSVQIDEVQPSVREDIKAGHNLLKSSFGLLMTHGEDLKESLLHRDLSEEKLNAEEDRELQEVNETDWTFWTRVVNDFATVANKEPEQLESEITKGIPRQIRGIIWQLIANSKSKEMEDIYETLSETESPHEANIRRDLKRTNFIPEDRIEELFRVLKIYSVYDPDVGYTQGMAFVTTPLLLNCNSEAETFGLLVSLMKYYHIREFYLPDMPGLMLMLYQFDRLLEENTPILANHLTREGIRSSMYATQWFLTIFAYKFPLEFVLKIFDIIFFEGIESLLKFAVNLMVKNEDILIKLKFDQLLTYLKNELFNIYLKGEDHMEDEINNNDDNASVKKRSTSISSTQIRMDTSHDTDYNAHLFVFDAMKNIIITPISLNRYTAEYDSINAIEKRRENEYDSIRIKNEQLQREKTKLEHDYHVLNEEHITIAKELIQYRLDIETLLDENNDLKDNLDTLNKQLDEEISKANVPNPDAELPIDLKQDLERTMKRNTEVTALNTLYQDKIAKLEETIKELKIINKSMNVPKTDTHLNDTTTTTTNNKDKSPSPQPIPQQEFQPQSSVGSTFSSGWSGFKKVFKK